MLQIFVILVCTMLRQVRGNYSCWPPPYKTEIYQNKWYKHGSLLTCFENVGMSMCVTLCQKMAGCGLVNFDKNQSHCHLVKQPGHIALNDMVTSTSEDFVAVMDETTVSFNSILFQIHRLWYYKSKKCFSFIFCIYPCSETGGSISAAHIECKERHSALLGLWY